MPESMLAHYEAKAKGMSLVELRFALSDVLETLKNEACYDPHYNAKLYAEKDAYSVECARRDSNGSRWKR
jgi:hypothetical protein